MKNSVLLGIFLSSLLAGYVSAGPTDAYFDAATGQIVLPQFKVDGFTFYLTLSLDDPDALTFAVDLESITDITPPESVRDTVNVEASDIVGSWGFPGTTTTVTFSDDGTYDQFQEAGVDENCSAGGIETGTYSWSPDTGILLANPITDANGECGLSNPRGNIPLRVFIEGNSMQVLERGDGVPLEEFSGFRI